MEAYNNYLTYCVANGSVPMSFYNFIKPTWKPLKLTTEDLFEHVSASPSGITYKMLDPAHTNDENIQTLCDELKITGLTWEIQDDDLLFVYKDPTAFVLEDDEEEEENDE